MLIAPAVLLIEDSATANSLTKRLLRALPAPPPVLKATNGREGLAQQQPAQGGEVIAHPNKNQDEESIGR